MQASFASKFDVLTRLDVRSKMLIAALAAVMTIALYNVAALSICARSIQTNFCELCCLASDDGAVRGICLCVGFVYSFHG